MNVMNGSARHDSARRSAGKPFVSAPAAAAVGSAPSRPSRFRRLTESLFGRAATLVLAVVALLLGIATFVLLAGGVSLGVAPDAVIGMLVAAMVVLLVLGAVVAARLTHVWVERRRGSAGSRLHVRLVLLFSGVAVTPAIVVAVFSTCFFDLGIQAWFNDRVRTALNESLQASRGYLAEHRNTIRADALGMANDLTRAGRLLMQNPNAFGQVLYTQTALRGLTEAILFDTNGKVIASTGPIGGLGTDPPPAWAMDVARSGDVAVLDGDDTTRVRAVVGLDATPPVLLMISRPVDPAILDHMARTEHAVAEYDRLDQNRSGLEVTFALIFAMVALLILAAAVLIGLVLANQIARPIGRLIAAAERVRAGDLAVNVPEEQTGDEMAGLSRAFNRMTGQLAAQRRELMAAYSQIDARRRFTETVLAGVSAGVIGLDPEGRIELPNRAASELLGSDLLAAIGRKLGDVVPELAPLMSEAQGAPERAGGDEKPRTAEVEIGPPTRRRTLLVRIGVDRRVLPPEVAIGQGPRGFGFVATFDDITELQSAQRKAAWADVARRIAHEIKNPLTPIQLAAERLKRRFAREITSDQESFTQCADTIVRHVGDIRRMVDEFSAFSRMPQPVIRPEDVGRITREAMVLQRTAHPEIAWETAIPERGPVAACDRRLLVQALSNLLLNAADSIAMRVAARHDVAEQSGGSGGGPGGFAGHIAVTVDQAGSFVRVAVADDGVGLPAGDRSRLVEPYVTHKPKGTGLGLAIVKKVMEDHGGRVTLEDRAPYPGWGDSGAMATLWLPLEPPQAGSDRAAIPPA